MMLLRIDLLLTLVCGNRPVTAGQPKEHAIRAAWSPVGVSSSVSLVLASLRQSRSHAAESFHHVSVNLSGEAAQSEVPAASNMTIFQ
jgi:hypothetical protein